MEKLAPVFMSSFLVLSTLLGTLSSHVAIANDEAASMGENGFECVIEARTKTRVGSPSSGLVKKILVKRGDKVKKGQIIAKLESSLQKVAVELALMNANDQVELQSRQSRLKLEHDKTERARTLFSKKMVSQSAVDEAETAEELAMLEVQAAKSEQLRRKLILKEARSELALRVVHSPLNGVVTEKMMSVGEFTHEQSPILEIAEIDPLYVEAFLPINLYEHINMKNKATVKPAAPLSGDFQARITVIDQIFDAASGTFGVRMELDNKKGLLPAGVPCQVLFSTK